jgi:hypothetical protein
MQPSVANSALWAFIFATAFSLVPLIIHAQTTTSQSDLSATIRAELLSDPRTSGLSQTQLDAIVSLLTKQAQSQGITVHDITWRPQPLQFGSTNAPEAIDVCAGIPRYLCAFDEAFGFVGPDVLIAYILGVSSMGLTWILAEMIHRHRMAGNML